MKSLKILGVVVIGGGVIYYLLSSTNANAGRQVSRSGVVFNPGVRGVDEAASFGRVSPTLANLWNAPDAVFANVARTYDVIEDSRAAFDYHPSTLIGSERTSTGTMVERPAGGGGSGDSFVNTGDFRHDEWRRR